MTFNPEDSSLTFLHDSLAHDDAVLFEVNLNNLFLN